MTNRVLITNQNNIKLGSDKYEYKLNKQIEC